MRFSSLSMRAFSFNVESGIPVSCEILIRRPVNGRLLLATQLSIRSWLSFKVLRRSLRRSSTPLIDIGGCSLSSPVGTPHNVFKSLLGSMGYPMGCCCSQREIFWKGGDGPMFLYLASACIRVEAYWLTVELPGSQVRRFSLPWS